MASRHRSYVVAALATFMSTVGMEHLERTGWQGVGWISVCVPAGIALFVLLAVLVGRRKLLSNAVNRRILLGIGAVLGCLGGHRLLALSAGIPAPFVALGDAPIVCAALLVAGATIQPASLCELFLGQDTSDRC